MDNISVKVYVPTKWQSHAVVVSVEKCGGLFHVVFGEKAHLGSPFDSSTSSTLLTPEGFARYMVEEFPGASIKWEGLVHLLG